VIWRGTSRCKAAMEHMASLVRTGGKGLRSSDEWGTLVYTSARVGSIVHISATDTTG
jgi:hypothetical protein